MIPNHHGLRVKPPQKRHHNHASFPLEKRPGIPLHTSPNINLHPRSAADRKHNQKRKFLPVKTPKLLRPRPTPYPRQPMRKRHPKCIYQGSWGRGWGYSERNEREQTQRRSRGGVLTQADQQAGGLLRLAIQQASSSAKREQQLVWCVVELGLEAANRRRPSALHPKEGETCMMHVSHRLSVRSRGRPRWLMIGSSLLAGRQAAHRGGRRRSATQPPESPVVNEGVVP